ncbi:MaoC family dehydratase [Oleomonas cavernae]|uniref:MaoC family dehydratase n=1 Tax=Oleomonas cavernae TaxID=2320859 RepID=A0A418W9Q5_9PROT|nr:MaoC family dehydratase [Oleomonas cavernae]RJF86728.1 MaoC family dehydratase [Oleomonas cavernae]
MAETGAPAADLLHFEDFEVGKVETYGDTQITEADILEFAREFDPLPIHVDAEAAANSPFGGLIASGAHSCSIMMRLMCDGYMLRATSLGSPGVDEVRYLLPVRPGDRLRLRMEVVEARRSRSRPTTGVVTSRQELVNQNGEIVLEMRASVMFRCRSAGEAA